MSVAANYQATVEPRKVTRSEIGVVAETLAAAFFDDPVIRWAWHDPDRRREILPDFFELLAGNSLEYDEAYTVDDQSAAALWLPPTAQNVSDSDEAVFVAAIERVAGEFAEAVLRLFAVLEQWHPREPHYYLPVIGVGPGHQGRGLGSVLLAAVLERCDNLETPAYLAATTPRNRALYERHGFRVTSELAIPGGPPIWPMWREPRADLRGRTRRLQTADTSVEVK